MILFLYCFGGLLLSILPFYDFFDSFDCIVEFYLCVVLHEVELAVVSSLVSCLCIGVLLTLPTCESDVVRVHPGIFVVC